MKMLTDRDIDRIAERTAEIVLRRLGDRTAFGKYLTFDEAKSLMKIKSDATMRERIRSGDVTAKKDGGKWKIFRDSVERYMDSDRIAIEDWR